MSATNQTLYSHICGVGIVDQHGIAGKTLNAAVYLDDRNIKVGRELLEFCGGNILGEIDQTVYAVGKQKTQVIPFPPVIGAVAGDQHMVAVFPKGALQRVEHIAEEDNVQYSTLQSAGWQVLKVWKCELTPEKMEATLKRLETQIRLNGKKHI